MLPYVRFIFVGTMSGSVELPWAYALAHLGIMLELRGGLLGRLGPSMLALCWPSSGPSWDYVETMLCLLGRRGPMLAELGTILGLVGPSWAYVGPAWDYVLPGSYVWDYIGFGWADLGRLGPMLAQLGTMLGVPGFYVGPSWLCVGLSWGYVAPSSDYVERRKDIKVQKLYENMFPSQFFTVFAVFFTHSTF